MQAAIVQYRQKFELTANKQPRFESIIKLRNWIT